MCGNGQDLSARRHSVIVSVYGTSPKTIGLIGQVFSKTKVGLEQGGERCSGHFPLKANGWKESTAGQTYDLVDAAARASCHS